MDENGLIPDIRHLLDMFQTGYWSRNWIPGSEESNQQALDAACEALAGTTDEEFQKLLLVNPGELQTGITARELCLDGKLDKAPLLEESETNLPGLYRSYRNAVEASPDFETDPVMEAAGALIEEVLMLFNANGATYW